MKVLLLGPNGQLGSDIRACNAAADASHAIQPLARDSVDLADIDKAADLIRGAQFDVLINCSGFHKTEEAERDPRGAFLINADLVERLAVICREKKARFVHVSTDYVFGGQDKRTPLEENDPRAPINVHGASKSVGEDLARMTGADVIVLRVASLFGVAGTGGKGGNFVETMIRVGREKSVLRVVNDQLMSPTASADVAAILLRMLDAGVPAGVWHVVNAGAASWYDFALRIVARAGINATVAPISSAEFPSVARRPPYSVLATGKIAAALGPMRPWQEALDAYLVAKGYRAGQGAAQTLST
jgi:dTDP-4-dehydrorhamnose reductase